MNLLQRQSYRRREAGLPPQFTSLYQNHHDFVWRCALRLGGNDAIVDDLVQETFLVALRRLDEFDREGPARASTWLFAILRNVMRNHDRSERRRMRRHEIVGELESSEGDPNAAARYLALGLLQDFLDTLTPERRAVFVLAELEGHSSREIGEALGINAATVRTRLRAARAEFSRAFSDTHAASRVVTAIENGREQPLRANPDRRKVTLQAIAVAAAGELPVFAGALGSIGASTWLTKLALAGLGLITVAGGVGLAMGSRPAPRSSTSEASKSPIMASAEPSKPVPSAVEAEDQDQDHGHDEVEGEDQGAGELGAIVVRAPARRSPKSANSSADDASGTLEELRILAHARQALLEGRPEASLMRLRGVDAWSRPAVAARALGLELGALCALDRPDDARDRAQAWAAAHPDQPLDSRANHLCW